VVKIFSDEVKKLREEEKRWEETTVQKVISRFPERREEFLTDSFIPVKRTYTPADVEDLEYEDLNFPGQWPFVRGVQPTMYRGRLWTMRQYAGFGTAEETNKRYKYLLEQGQMGLSVAFDLPTQIGYDSDHELAEGEVGKVGVAVDTLADMEVLFDGIPLDKVSTSMTINATASVLLAMYIAVAKKQGVDPKVLRGTIQNDVLKEYVARGTYIFPPAPSLKIITDIFEFCKDNVPKWNTISISGYHIREAGSTAIQELAFTFANAIEYVKAAIEKGLAVDDFAPRLSFFFAVHNDFFEEIAKFRAARRIWARIMKERFGATNPKSMMLRFHTQTGGSTLTAQQPLNNIVRVAIQALAAVIGGTQSLHTNSYDEALALPTEESVRIALRTQQIIAEESGVVKTVDPMGGSWYVEYLTNEIEKRVWEYLDKIEKMGGSVRAIEAGYIQQEIANSAYRYQLEVENGERIIVGVNKYRIENEKPPENLLKVDESVRERQIARLKEIKKKRDNERVKKALEKVRNAAERGENVMYPILEAVEAYASLGEICDCLRDIYGEYTEPVII